MKTKGETLTASKKSARATEKIVYKGSELFITKLQGEEFLFISTGKRSSNQIIIACKTSSARDIVIALIKKGITIHKEIVEAQGEIPRHKLYFIDPKECK